MLVSTATSAASLVFAVPAVAEGAITLRGRQRHQARQLRRLHLLLRERDLVRSLRHRRQWKLAIEIAPFDGFHSYHVGYAKMGKVEFVARKQGVTYTNTVFPRDTSTPETGEGGNLGFPGGGGRIGLAFGTAFAVDKEDQYASLFGLAACK